MQYRRAGRSGFTLIELLVVVAIIAILAVVVVLTLNPQQLLRQSRDSSRLSDLATLNSALGIYTEDQGATSNFNLGATSTTYISVSDPSATSTAGDQCQGLNLTALGTGYSYHCDQATTNRNVDSTGWIPVNLNKIASGAPIGDLPVDPINQTSTNFYYTYTTDGSRYEVTAVLESQKYKAQFSTAYPITYFPEVIAQGTNLGLSELYSSSGLVGYWNFEEGSGTTVSDLSGNGNNGTWSGTANGVSGYYSGGQVGSWSGYFNGSNDQIAMPNAASLNPSTAVSVCIWINPTSNTTARVIEKGNTSGGTESYYLYLAGNVIHMGVNDVGWNDAGGVVTPGAWNFVCGTYDGAHRNLYVNGVQSYSIVQSGSIGQNALSFYISNNLFGGYMQAYMDDVRVYNRALSPGEVLAIYNADK